MSDVTFPSSPGIFRDRGTLQESYTPETIVGRDTELREIRDALVPAVYGEKPNNVFVYGKSGVGKTACTEYMMRELTQTCDDRGVDLTTVTINCERLNTSNQTAASIGNSLDVDRDHISEYQSEWKVYDEMFKRLEEVGGIVVIVLDEVDALNTEGLNEVFYQLTRAGSNEYIDSVRIGTVGISSDLQLRREMRPDVKSSLCESSIEFSAYDSEQLLKVLEQRSELAFEPGVITEDAMRVCAGCGAQDGGDARKAIDLLRKAGDLARKNDKERVSAELVQTAREEMRSKKVVASVEGLSYHERIAIYALATLDAENGDDMYRSREVFDRYEDLVGQTGSDPLTYRRVQQYLHSFDEMSLTETESRHRGRNGGTFRVHTLQYPVEDIVRALHDTIDQCGVHRSVSNLV